MPEAIRSPNIWDAPEVYEVENRGADPDGAIWRAMRSVQDWTGLDVLDVGCGSGFHLPYLAQGARHVTGVEPHPPLVAMALQRVRGLPGVTVLAATAQHTGLPDRCVDVAHARWAYFFGPGCEPGLAELDRVIRPGGAAFVIDNDATRSSFGAWFRRGRPTYDPAAVERFWTRHGWTRERVEIRWAFGSRADFEAVVGIEFAPARARDILERHPGLTGVDYAVNLWWRRF